MTVRPLSLPSILVALCTIGPGATVLASGTELDATPRVIPYNGVLELNGTAYNGSADVQVTLTTSAQTCTFTEEHEAISVYAGRFSINIGTGKTGGASNTSVPTCLFDVTTVSLSLGVRSAGGSTYTTLSGTQRIRPVPFAYWSAEGSDLKVDGNLEVRGADIRLGTNDGRTGSDSAQFALSHIAGSSATTDRLMLNYGSGFGGGIELVGPNLLTGGNTLTGGTTVGGGKPASGTPQLRLGNNDGASRDDWNDYQLLLYRESTPAGSYGLGTEHNALWLNSPADIRLMSGNSTRFETRSTGAKVTGDLEVTGTISNATLLTRSGTHSTGRNNSGGTNVVDIGADNGRMMCFLSKVSLEDIDGVGEIGECTVYVRGSDNHWVLQAYLGSTSDADVNCEARCLSW